MTFSYAPEPTGPQPQKTLNGVGLAALIVGGAALIGSVIPIVNLASGFLAFVGIVLGIIALVLKNRPKGMAVVGLIVSVIALVLSIVLAIVYTAGIVTAITGVVKESEARSSAEASDVVRVTYQVSGAGGTTSASVQWSTTVGGEVGSEQLSDQALPFTREIVVPDTSAYDFATLSVTGVAGVSDAVTEGGDVSCRILADGLVVAEETASGVGATVTCSVAADEILDTGEGLDTDE